MTKCFTNPTINTPNYCYHLLSTTVFQADIPVDILNPFKLWGYKDLPNNSWDGRDGTKIHTANERRSVWAKGNLSPSEYFCLAPVPEFFRSWFTLAIAFPARLLGSPMGQFQIITEKFVVALNCPQHPFVLERTNFWLFLLVD